MSFFQSAARSLSNCPGLLADLAEFAALAYHLLNSLTETNRYNPRNKGCYKHHYKAIYNKRYNAMTSLIRFSPSLEMRHLQREIDRVFDGFLPGHDEAEQNQSVWAPRVDLSETEEAYLIHLDVPGMSKDELEINFHDGTLSVRGERRAEEREENHKFVRVERQYGHFFRSFTLPKAVKHEEIGADYVDGVLTINVPKAEESKPRRIEVR